MVNTNTEAVMNKEMSFSVLWGSNDHRADENSTPFATDQEAKVARDNLYYSLKKQEIGRAHV